MIFHRGETKRIVLDLEDAAGASVDITGLTDARAALGSSPEGLPALTKGLADLEVTEVPAAIAILLSDAESAALPLGAVYVQVWVQLDGRWAASEQKSFEVRAGIGGP